MAKLRLPKSVCLPIGQTPKRPQSYFLHTGNVTTNQWLLKRAYPAKARAAKDPAR